MYRPILLYVCIRYTLCKQICTFLSHISIYVYAVSLCIYTFIYFWRIHVKMYFLCNSSYHRLHKTLQYKFVIPLVYNIFTILVFKE